MNTNKWLDIKSAQALDDFLTQGKPYPHWVDVNLNYKEGQEFQKRYLDYIEANKEKELLSAEEYYYSIYLVDTEDYEEKEAKLKAGIKLYLEAKEPLVEYQGQSRFLLIQGKNKSDINFSISLPDNGDDLHAMIIYLQTIYEERYAV